MLCNNVFTLQTFAKFRCGVAPLRLETGRYERLSQEQRTCFYCTDCIESEEHDCIAVVLLIVPNRYFCGGSFCFMSWCLKYFCAVGALCMFAYF